MIWKGVFPAITTWFDEKHEIDYDFMAEHCTWLVDNGCSGIVALGSLGEGATLSFEEKLGVLHACMRSTRNRCPLIAAVSALGTSEAVAFARAARDLECQGLLVLPPYVYQGDWREMRTYVGAVFDATELPCMLYNNPVAYGTDFLPEQIEELAVKYKNLEALKESSADPRRISSIRASLADRLSIFVGVDDLIVEGCAVGASGWIAGLANALPRESVELFLQAVKGNREQLLALYYWFLPLLQMDTVPKFVQLIKLVQQEVGIGTSHVRPPRLELCGPELEHTQANIRDVLHRRPTVISSSPVAFRRA